MGTAESVARIGMDVHRTFSRATARDGQQRVLWRRRLEHRDRPSLRHTLTQWPAGTPVVLEGSFGWSWLVDELAQARLVPHLASSRKVAAWRTLHGLAKSNRTDADLLSLLAFEPPRLWEVWLPPPAVRQQREWLRYRMTLVQSQTGYKNRVHAILHRHGLFSDLVKLFGCTGRRWLQQLALDAENGLPESARASLRGYLQLLDQLRLQIARATRLFHRQLQADPAALRLTALPGIKWILGYTLRAEIGRIERFPSGRHLVSYSLLAPRAYDSGEEDDGPPQGRHVGHCGRRTLKWAYIEAAHGAVYKSPALRAWFDEYTQGGRQNRNRGYIGVARRLCLRSYAVWKKEQDYREEPAPRPGSRAARRRRTRPVKGQPADAMVAVAPR